MLTIRVTYHTQLFGEGLNANSPAYSSTVSHLGGYLIHNAGSTAAMAAKQGQYLLMSNIGKQAFVQAICDDFLLAAGITLISAIPVFFLRLNKKKKQPWKI
jgi:DHA2 family multidrug resistance protein